METNVNPNWLPPTLESERLILRPLRLEDAANIYAYAKNPNVAKYVLWNTYKSIDDAHSFIKDYAFAKYAVGEPEPMAITLKSDPDKVIGCAGCFWRSKPHKVMEMGFVLAEEHWGKGIIAEAARTVFKYVTKEFDFERMQITCKSENTQSARVIEKLGFKFEGVLRNYLYSKERSWDSRMYALTRTEMKEIYGR